MAHLQQQEFCKSIQGKFPNFFKNKFVLDIGSLDINGNNQEWFHNCKYLGVDIAYGQNVDIVSKGHELGFPDGTFDIIISTECFEHDQYYDATIKNIYRMLKPGGLFIFTCATTGRPEHGTRRTTPEDAPLLQSDIEWSDYYKNLTESDIREVLNIESAFNNFEFSTNDTSRDLYFYGFKVGTHSVHSGYSSNSYIDQLVNIGNVLEEIKIELEHTRVAHEQTKLELAQAQVEHEQTKIEFIANIKTLENEILKYALSRSWKITRPIRLLVQKIKGN